MENFNLIIGKSFNALKTGYPTVSDKYNVLPATLTGISPADFGHLVKLSDTNGYMEAITETVTIDKIAGFIVATNVKVTEDYPGTIVQVNPGEAFNLLLDGFIAVAVDEGATESKITPKAKVAVDLTTGAITTADKINSSTIVELPNVVFTGTFENHGDERNKILVAEVYVK